MHRCHFEIVHAGTFQGAVGEVEAGGLDDMHRRAETRGQPQDRAGIARHVRLVESDV